LQSRTLAHNQTHTFRFPKQPHSAGQRYVLQLSGNKGNRVTVWGYTLDSYGAGELSLVGTEDRPGTPPLTAKDLRFVTRYQLQLTDSLMALGTILWRQGPLLLLALAFLPLPGALLLIFFGRHGWRWEPAAWWGAAYGLGIAAWVMLWAGFTWLGLRWAAWSLWRPGNGHPAQAGLWRPGGGTLRARAGWLGIQVPAALGCRLALAKRPDAGAAAGRHCRSPPSRPRFEFSTVGGFQPSRPDHRRHG